MYFLKYLNYKMYKMFLKQGDSSKLALIYACIATSLLFLSIFIMILNIYCIVIGIEPLSILKYSVKGKLFIFFAIILFLNYYLIYYNQKYVNFFKKIYSQEQVNKYSDILFFCIKWGTIIITILSFYYLEYKKYGHIRF